ncbi:peptidase S1 and S6, chymotrypsin/Hap domain protein [Mycobacterium xenopi 3993]|nr:peptidase S1 and S6, chymotrypsin/Hap domain protein [Mycobacterium xenopi 3993]
MSPSVASLAVRSRRGEGSGSASVITPDGYLLTSAHVVGSARFAEATFTDGATVTADVAGRDVLSDLAVLKARDLFPPRWSWAAPRTSRSDSWWWRWATRWAWRAA